MFTHLLSLARSHMHTPLTGEEHIAMMTELGRLAEEGLLRHPLYTEHTLNQRSVQKALDNSMEPFVGRKQLIVMDPSCRTMS